MNSRLGGGKRLVMRVVLLQAACALIVGALFASFQGAAAARSAVAGGVIVVVGTAAFGWRMFAPGIAPAATLRRAMYAAESLKWFWYVFALWVAFAHSKLMPLPVLTGIVVGQFCYWIGLIETKRG